MSGMRKRFMLALRTLCGFGCLKETRQTAGAPHAACTGRIAGLGWVGRYHPSRTGAAPDGPVTVGWQIRARGPRIAASPNRRRRAFPMRGQLSRLALGLAGAVVLSVGVAIGSGATFSLIDAPRAISPAAEQALSVISNDVPFVVLLVGVVAFMAGHGIAIVRRGVLPRWLGWAAVVVGIVAAIPVVGWLALFGLILWSIVAGVVLFIREGRPAAVRTAATPAA
jgi:hypothetical protein